MASAPGPASSGEPGGRTRATSAPGLLLRRRRSRTASCRRSQRPPRRAAQAGPGDAASGRPRRRTRASGRRSRRRRRADARPRRPWRDSRRPAGPAAAATGCAPASRHPRAWSCVRRRGSRLQRWLVPDGGRGDLASRQGERRPTLPDGRLARVGSPERERPGAEQRDQPESHGVRARGLEPLRSVSPNGT